jgi:hypothetical protein
MQIMGGCWSEAFETFTHMPHLDGKQLKIIIVKTH